MPIKFSVLITVIKKGLTMYVVPSHSETIQHHTMRPHNGMSSVGDRRAAMLIQQRTVDLRGFRKHRKNRQVGLF